MDLGFLPLIAVVAVVTTLLAAVTILLLVAVMEPEELLPLQFPAAPTDLLTCGEDFAPAVAAVVVAVCEGGALCSW